MPLADDFKQALASWASGVAVVTAAADGLLYGLTVSSFTAVSLEPPLVLVCIANDNHMASMVGPAGAFGVSMLAEDQEEASRYFSVSGREPTRGFTEIPGTWLESGVPVVDGAMAQLACRLVSTAVHGDHTIVVGEVVEATADASKPPLMYFRRAYRRLPDDPDAG